MGDRRFDVTQKNFVQPSRFAHLTVTYLRRKRLLEALLKPLF
jgi:hypothetical protein